MGKVEGEVKSLAFLRVAEVRLGKVVGQVSTVGPLPSAKEGEDVAIFQVQLQALFGMDILGGWGLGWA